MAETDDYLRALLEQFAAEEEFLDSFGQAKDVKLSGAATQPGSSPVVSLMITNQQRAQLRELGFSEETTRLMTPAEAHAQLGLAKPSF
jgi:hypothetical protein